MVITIEDRTAYFLEKMEAMWPGRVALSVKETAQTLHVMFGAKNGAGAEELVRRAIKSGQLIPGLGRPGGRHWRIPLLDLAHHFGAGFQPGDLATTEKVAKRKAKVAAAEPVRTYPPAKPGRRARIVPSTFLKNHNLSLHMPDGEETWMPTKRALRGQSVRIQVTSIQSIHRQGRTDLFWNDVKQALLLHRTTEHTNTLSSARSSRIHS